MNIVIFLPVALAILGIIACIILAGCIAYKAIDHFWKGDTGAAIVASLATFALVVMAFLIGNTAFAVLF